MIEAYTLESLLKKYGIDATKVINKNNNILEYGEYQDIDKTLNYLVKELHINARNIEKLDREHAALLLQIIMFARLPFAKDRQIITTKKPFVNM